jgi:hypothetical protein
VNRRSDRGLAAWTLVASVVVVAACSSSAGHDGATPNSAGSFASGGSGAGQGAATGGACSAAGCIAGTGGASTGNLGGGAGASTSGVGASHAATPDGGASSATGTGAAGASAGRDSGAGGSGDTQRDAGAASCDTGQPTVWATACPTAPKATCVDGTWVDPGSTTNDPTVCQSDHFAVHAPNGTITAAQCTAATDTLETVVWPTLFGSPIFFPEPYCASAMKYKASIVVHSDYGLTGGGWGNGYMGMWIGPGGTADHWGLAHEFMHAVQAQTKGLACGGSSNYCGWIYESHANWRAQQLPEYHTTNVHCSEMLANAPHLYLGSTRDRYCNWQFMEFLKDKYCYDAVNAIWTAPTPSSDPFDNIASTRGWTLSQLNDFFGEWAMHNVTWDYQDPAPESTAGMNQGALFRSSYGDITDVSKPERRLRTTRLEVLDAGNQRYAVPSLQAPQRYGYNIVRLYPDASAQSVTVVLRGVVQAEANTDFRWGLVATDAAITTARYSKLVSGTDGTLTFCVAASESLFLVVTATPSVATHINWDQLYPTIYRYPYMVEIHGASPEGYQPNAPNPSQNGMRWPNGGGWVAAGASVAQGAYVGPLAAVLGGTVGAGARIDDHAVVVGGTVMSGTVAGLSVLARGYTIDGGANVTLSWPYGPGWFENPQTLSGSVSLFGDVELRGANRTESTGKDCGFVDVGVSNNCDMADVTVAPPYTWRP